MEYFLPSVNGESNKQVYSTIKWLNKDIFLEKVPKIYPCLENDDGSNVYIGKSISNDDQDGKMIQYIGSVKKNSKGQWQLNIPFATNVEKIVNFHVLSIDNPKSFYWEKTEQDKIPKNALRGSFDETSHEFLFIGKNSVNSDHGGQYYLRFTNDGDGYWPYFNENIPNLIGKVQVSHSCLYLPVNSIELRLKEYDILCLRPSPASLKKLSQLAIRSILNNSQSKLSLINDGQIHLPKSLLKQYVMFPTFLTTGQKMIIGDKIVREDGLFEIELQQDANICCFVCNRLIGGNKYEISRYVGVQAVELQEFMLIFLYTNHKSHIDKRASKVYKLKINNDQLKANYKIEFIK